jgi:hypothetical protein
VGPAGGPGARSIGPSPVEDLVGDGGDGLPGRLRAVDLDQVSLHLAGDQAFADSEMTSSSTPGQPLLPLCHDLGLEVAVPVPRNLDLDRADVGEHGLRTVPVAGVAPVAPCRVVLVVAEVGPRRGTAASLR